MNLQPSTSFMYNDRRELFAWELNFGGHGQQYLSGAGTFTPTADSVFYQIDFLTSTAVTSAGFRTVHTDTRHTGTIYTVSSAFGGITFPAGFTWHAPLTSITLGSGTAIAYEYKKFIPEDLTNI